MTQKDPRPPKAPWLIPYLTVKDASAALLFYEKAFGFSCVNAMQDSNGVTQHVEMHYQDALIMFGAEGAHGNNTQAPVTSKVPSPITLYLYCDDIDHFCERAQRAGAEVLSQPQDMFWGDRMASLQDPDGYHWSFATHLGSKG